MADDTEGGTLRMHYIDEGPRNGEVILMLHGEPSWSYLYRKMIPIFVEAGFRAIAPDLIGFGRSDKPIQLSDYTHQRHIDWLHSFVTQLQLAHINLVCQDWGGVLGLRLVADAAEKFSRVVAANTLFPLGDIHPGKAFTEWQNFARTSPIFPISSLVANLCKNAPLTPEETAAYDAPYPDESYKSGARQLPMLAPVTPDNIAAKPSQEAWEKLKQFNKPFLTAFSDMDPATATGAKMFQESILGCSNQAHVTIQHSGHFLQEEKGEQFANVILHFIETNKRV